MSAGTTVACKPEAHFGKLASCMDPTFDISCPKNTNDATTLPFLKTASVKCKACAGEGQQVTDLDPVKGKYSVSLKWGRNMMNGDGTGSLVKAAANGDVWLVLLVDEYGKIYGTAGTATTGNNGQVNVKKMGEQTCCNPIEYQMNIRGTWKTGATRFMIVPAVKNDVGKIQYQLPMGIMSQVFIDKTTGSVTEHKGKLVMQVSNVKAFLENPHRFDIMTDSIAAAAELPREYISIESMTSGRRLTEFDTNLRRLTAGALSVNYKVLIPDTYQGKKFTAASIDTKKLTAHVVAKAQAAGMTDFAVTSVDVKPVTTQTITGETTVTGGASPTGLSGLIAVLMLVAGQQIL